MGSDVVFQDTTLLSGCWFHISFPVTLLQTAWSRDGAHMWRSCWCTHKLEQFTQYRWKRCLPRGLWALCTTSTTDVSLGSRDLSASPDVAPEVEPRCCQRETHKSWAHGALIWTCIKLQHQNFYWPQRSGKKSQTSQAAEKSHIEWWHTTLPSLNDSFVQAEMQFPGAAATGGVQSKRGSTSGVKLSKVEWFVVVCLSIAAGYAPSIRRMWICWRESRGEDAQRAGAPLLWRQEERAGDV